MVRLLKHQWLTVVGCVLWCASFLGEENGLQPYSTVGLCVSPILLIAGIFYWSQHHYQANGRQPEVGKKVRLLIEDMTKNPFFGIGFLVRHLLQFWTICILFWMGIIFLTFCLFVNSDAFKATKEYCEKNTSVLLRTGKINYYSPLFSGSIHMHNDDGEAELYFTIVGTKGSFEAKSSLTKRNGRWTLQQLEFD